MKGHLTQDGPRWRPDRRVRSDRQGEPQDHGTGQSQVMSANKEDERARDDIGPGEVYSFQEYRSIVEMPVGAVPVKTGSRAKENPNRVSSN